MELYFKSREEWRKWLSENHATSDGIWFIFYKKPSGKISVAYNDAVEEALCFGWIDGKIKRINEDYYIQWFTRRRQGSKWSELNIGRMRSMIDGNLAETAGINVFEEAMKNPGAGNNKILQKTPSMPDDLLNELRKNSAALENFLKFPPSTRKMYIFWLNDAKRQETRQKRILKIVDRSEQNIKSVML